MRKAICMMVVAAAVSVAASGENLSAKAFGQLTCQNQADFAMQGCIDDIVRLYEGMERAFADAHRLAPRSAVEAEQGVWLTALRENCRERICTREWLSRRTIELRGIEMSAYDVAESPMTDAEANKVCSDIAAIESRGDIGNLLLPIESLQYPIGSDISADAMNNDRYGQLEHQFKLELRKDQQTDFGDYMGRGTCVMMSIAPRKLVDPIDDAKWPQTTSIDESEEELHLIGWGGGESVLAYRGRHYIATFGGDGHGIVYLEWLTPAATRRGLCTFDDTGSRRVVAERVDPQADCEALASAKDEVAGLVDVDLDDDGKADPLSVGGEDSSAGCGRSWRNVQLVDGNGDPEASPRNEALGQLVGVDSGPVTLLRLKGNAYVYAMSGDFMSAAYRVTKSGVVPQCKFRLLYDRRVKTRFSFEKQKESPDL